jgi:hypothetical protein
MTLNGRLDKIAAALGRDDDFLAMLIVLQENDGRWWTFEGQEVDPETLDPRTQVIVFRERPDGPQ